MSRLWDLISLTRFTILTSCFSLAVGAACAQAGIVEIRNDQLHVDGQPQPQLWGAEIQYFRLRGGAGPNIPRSTVIELWARALDRAAEAKMNTVSFYIPWDFHEYAEGKFDFDGTVDEDGDGNPDYPSRDVRTFIKMIEERGFKHVMARPGPFINAEWGFLGFGAVPIWFHDKYPDSHTRNSKGQRTTLYSYHDPDLLRHSRIWLTTVYHQVLKPYIGAGRIISFIQVDNETNFQWQSIFNHDYEPRGVARYQAYLLKRYMSIAALNQAHGRSWRDFSEVQPPKTPYANIAEDQDWHRFKDQSIYLYLKQIRQVWTDLGVHEPTVLFTLAESYNAPEDGLLPHYRYRNSRDTGMMTVNLYPKTYETPDQTLWNLPFKADHDVKAADAASDYYLGRKEQWVIGPEIQGGWWKGIHVSDESRRQTYLTTLGHGLKGLFIYYFNEGDNWNGDWLKKQLVPYYEELKKDPRYRDIAEQDLPYTFWGELDTIVANKFLAVHTKHHWVNNGTQPEKLYFDAPLGPDAQPRAPYRQVKEIGEKIIQPYGDFLGRAVALEDNVCLIKDSNQHVPSPIRGLNSRIIHSDWTGGLIGLLMHAGYNPRMIHWDLGQGAELLNKKNCAMILYQDTGLAPKALVDTLARAVDGGASVWTFLDPGVANQILAMRSQNTCAPLPAQPMEVHGFRCAVGNGHVYHARVAFYDVFNTDFYYLIHDAPARRDVVENVFKESGLHPHIRIKGGGDRTVAFARTSRNDELWVTVKTALRKGFNGQIQWRTAGQDERYSITDVFAQTSVTMTGRDLSEKGFAVTLGDSGSTAFYIRQLPANH